MHRGLAARRAMHSRAHSHSHSHSWRGWTLCSRSVTGAEDHGGAYATQDSPWPVAETVERLTAALVQRGLTIFATIDQRAAAQRAGLELRDTVLIQFGSPAAGTPVMDAVPLAALDLPLKLLVWDDHGATRVSYLRPEALARRHDLEATLAAPLSGFVHLVETALAPGGDAS